VATPKRPNSWLKSVDSFGKRAFDLIVSGIALAVLSPLLLAIGLMVRLIDGAPILFFQKRPGKHGKIFRIVKFRTMKEASSSAIKSDEFRLTRLGKFLRATSLDELPELWNVFVGDMSFVGPRPLIVEYLPRYNSNQSRRHNIRPGITGLAQIHGRNQQSWEKRFEDDVWYVDHRNFALDLKILFITLYQVVRKEGISAQGFATMPEFFPSTNDVAEPANIEMSSAEINENDVAAVVKVVRSGRLALGPSVAEFEKNMAKYIGVKHAVAVSSGTAALHLIVKSLGIGPGDEVLVPSFTFAASVSAILYVGATPVFVDICTDTYNLDPADLERRRTSKTKAIMVVDVFGHSADWDSILSFAKKHQLLVIDDCCEALGAEYRGQKVGSFGNAGAFAFYPNKQITTGEGGMIVTNDDELARLCRSYRNQGRDEMGQWLDHARLGYNYRMDEMSGALGVSQLSRIESILLKRANVADMYNKRLANIPGVQLPVIKENMRMSWFVYVITLKEGLSASKLIRELDHRGIPSRAYFSPIHRQTYMAEHLTVTPILPVTDRLRDRTLALPFHNHMTREQVNSVARAIEEILSNKETTNTPVEMAY